MRDIIKNHKVLTIIAVILILGVLGSIGRPVATSDNLNEQKAAGSEQPLLDYAERIESYTAWSGSGKNIGEMGYLEITHEEFLNIDGDEIYEFMDGYYPQLKEKYNYVVVRSNKDEGLLINNSEIIDVGLTQHSPNIPLRENEQLYNSVRSPDGTSRAWVRDHENNTFVYIEEKN